MTPIASVQDLERREDPEPPAAGASGTERMRHRLRTAAGKKLYRPRQQTVEPVFGIIKEAMGFRRFSLRRLAFTADGFELPLNLTDIVTLR